MAQFLSGVDCGPTNALKAVSGRLERDYSLQQVRYFSSCDVPCTDDIPELWICTSLG